MAYNPLIIAVFLLLVAGVAALPVLGGPMGVGHDRTLQLAVIHAEFAACALLFLPARGSRDAVLRNLLTALACFAVASSVVLMLSFVARGGLPLQTRPAALGAWLFSAGVLSLGARIGADWPLRARVALMLVFAVPPLAHYLALEYAGASLLHLSGLSPSWALAAGKPAWLPLLPVAALTWIVALAIRNPKENHAHAA